MAKPLNEGRSAFLAVLLRVLVFLGVSNHLYDRRTQRIVYSSRAQVYRNSLNVACFIGIVLNHRILLQVIEDLVGKKAFLSNLTRACLYEYAVVIISGLVSGWRSRGRATRPLNELLGIRIEDSTSADELACVLKHEWKLISLKSILAVVILFSSVLTMKPQGSLTLTLGALAVCFIILQFNFVAIHLQFSMTMLYGGYLFKVLNLRLSRVVNEVNNTLYVSRAKSRRLKEELASIGLYHTDLLNLMIRIKDIDSLHLLVMLMSAFIYQVCALFYMVLALRGLFGKLSITTIFLSVGSTFLCTADLLVTLHICGECVKACDATGGVLKTLDSCLVMESSLERDIEVLSLQLAREKLLLTVCGMFNLDSGTGPGIFKAIMMHIILLAQIAFDEVYQFKE